MAYESTIATPEVFLRRHVRLIDVLFVEANGLRWGLARDTFAKSLHRSAAKRFPEGTENPAGIERYLRTLHLEDLALACACSEGLEATWEFFVAHFRQELRGACRAILRSGGSGDDSRADELADSLYAELYGIRSASGKPRKSLFDYFHGRSKLSTWLRAVLAQRYVDLLRADRGTISLDAPPDGNRDAERLELAIRTEAPAPDPDRAQYLARFDRALMHALAALTPRQRMLLAYYYVDHMKLAAIGAILKEHESTISRQLEGTRAALREAVTDLLHQDIPAQDGTAGCMGLDESQIELAFEYALQDWPFDLSQALSKAETAADSPDT